MFIILSWLSRITQVQIHWSHDAVADWTMAQPTIPYGPTRWPIAEGVKMWPPRHRLECRFCCRKAKPWRCVSEMLWSSDTPIERIYICCYASYSVDFLVWQPKVMNYTIKPGLNSGWLRCHWNKIVLAEQVLQADSQGPGFWSWSRSPNQTLPYTDFGRLPSI